MSNTVIGAVYSSIIEKIITDSKEDFEAAGLDQDTLQELKLAWQQQLSKLQVGQFPWDPPPAQQQMANPPTVPSNAKPEAGYKAESSASNSQHAQSTYNGTQVKQEQGIKYETPLGYTHQQPYAQARAEQNLRNQYGHQAAASIQATQARHMQQQQQQQQQQQKQQQQPQQQQQQQHQQQQSNGQRSQHSQVPLQQRSGQSQYPQQQPSLGAAQTDGAGDDPSTQWRTTLAERGGSPSDRLRADRQLRDYMDSTAAELDDGLLMPASEWARKGKKRIIVPSPTASALLRGVPQVDGADDEEDKEAVKKAIVEDEDAINSDLDDSEDELDNAGGDDDDGPMGETILCTYDKVQRVKNKWKCTLKDGILTTGKKEYVFHKANGEFEW